MGAELRQQAADQYDRAAAELEAAVDHLRITARRFRDDDRFPANFDHASATKRRRNPHRRRQVHGKV